ncbi:MAG TPA: MurR/RpiR family transcriptional regulator [Solirubrobacteraceae bacterium]|jgi:DNA-binding MurR/RpiR family transcriptional regulator|nr:MurR/RpiR family transcriptional regulator [Solirubrobacteraceae bacterium]
MTDPILAAEPSQDVLSELRHRYDELTNSQKRIAETIVDDPEFVAFATVDKFAGRLGISPSTIVRFAYRIGLGGYPDLQEQVRQLVRSNMRSGGDALAHIAGITGESLRHDLGLLERTGERLDESELSRAIELIVSAERVSIVGGVTTFSIAYYTTVTLDRIREGVSLVQGPAVPPAGPLRDMTERDVLIAFSFPPYAKTTIGAIKAAKRRGGQVIGVTDSPISPIRSQVDVLLLAAVSGVGSQNSLVAPMAIANALVNGVASSSPGALKRYGETMRLLENWDAYLLETHKEDA